MQPIILIAGTRPEGIKMMPLYFALKKAGIPTVLCATSQHLQLLHDVFEIFGVKPDLDLEIMKPNQDLFYLTQEVLEKTKKVFQHYNPSLVLVQGDTTTTYAAALSAFYLHIPVGHIEAGLRTNDIYHPFPEEMNRRLVSQIATYHFAPTKKAYRNLFKEHLPSPHIYHTGNTVVDALHMIVNKIESGIIQIDESIKNILIQNRKENKKTILLTAHRRESFKNEGIYKILQTIKQYAYTHPETTIVYPHHPNPHVLHAIEKSTIKQQKNIFLLPPLSYPNLIYILLNADWVVTDSGGIQEEAISLGKRVVVLREKTERIEGIESQLAFLAGTDQKKILDALEFCRMNPVISGVHSSIYGDGAAAQTICKIIKDEYTGWQKKHILSLSKK